MAGGRPTRAAAAAAGSTKPKTTTTKSTLTRASGSKRTAGTSKVTSKKRGSTSATNGSKARNNKKRKVSSDDDQEDEEEEESDEDDDAEESDKYTDDDGSSADDFQISPSRTTKSSTTRTSTTTTNTSNTLPTLAASSKKLTHKERNQKDEHGNTLNTFSYTGDRSAMPAVVIIPTPKGDGGPVADAIQPETLKFLADLKENNDRLFMSLNQARCEAAKADFLDFVRMLKEGLREADDDVLDEDPKKAMMRLHRDLRFSNDKRPFKTNFGCQFSKSGKKSIAAGYYFQTEPGDKSFVGCGVWGPDAPVLTRIRAGIANESERFRNILNSEAIIKIKGTGGIGALQQGAQLVNGPKGYAKDHPDIEFLKMKNLAIGRYFTDQEAVDPGFLEKILETFDACVEFVHILNEWIG